MTPQAEKVVSPVSRSTGKGSCRRAAYSRTSRCLSDDRFSPSTLTATTLSPLAENSPCSSLKSARMSADRGLQEDQKTTAAGEPASEVESNACPPTSFRVNGGGTSPTSTFDSEEADGVDAR